MPDDQGIKLKDILERNNLDHVKGGRLKIHPTPKSGSCIEVGEAVGIKGYDILRRVYSGEGKAPTLTGMGGGNREPKVCTSPTSWRILTPLECERLQNLEDGYTAGVSKTQRYKMIGNGFTIDVVSHILKGIK